MRKNWWGYASGAAIVCWAINPLIETMERNPTGAVLFAAVFAFACMVVALVAVVHLALRPTAKREK